jgi:hypothetical protein
MLFLFYTVFLLQNNLKLYRTFVTMKEKKLNSSTCRFIIFA